MKILRIKKRDITPKKYETHIIGPDEVATRVLAGSEAHREYVPFEKMPLNLIKAIITVEDRRFFHHHGVDIKGLSRSIAVDIVTLGRKLQGGSTITQQLIKNTVFPDWYSNTSVRGKLKRKFKEIILAIILERKIGKNEILENYLNAIYFGNGCYGVQTAAKCYFNKNVWELSLRECAILAGIPLSPAEYNPFNSNQKYIGRSNLVLKKMLIQRRISRKQYRAALLTDISEEINERRNAALSTPKPYSYFEEGLLSQVTSGIMRKKHISYKKAQALLYNGGLRIYSTEDQKIQRFCETIFADPHFIPDLGDANGPEAAMVLMDPNNGHILASVGGRGKKEASLVFNRAVDAIRNHEQIIINDFFDRTEIKSVKARGINILDLCIIYSNYESGGLTKSASFYKRVYNLKHKVVLTDKDQPDSIEPFDQQVEALTHDLHYPLPKLIELNTSRDVWAVGRVGNLVLGVWGGYDDNRPLPVEEMYFTYPRRIWKEIAEYIEKDYYHERNKKS